MKTSGDIMLQILSGKFYNKNHKIKRVNEKEIFYSNTKFLSPLKTDIGKVESINLNYIEGISSYILNINGLLCERYNPLGFPQASNQFRLLLSFWFKSIFETDKTSIEKSCRTLPEDLGDELIPVKIIPEFYKLDKVSLDIDSFNGFLKKMMNLSRDNYKSIMKSINSYVQAIKSVNYNLELSYSLMIFSIESLFQEFDDFEESWENYDKDIRINLDYLVKEYEIKPDDYEELKNTILKKEKQNLSNRFINFSIKNVSDSFFKEESESITNPIKKSDLHRILKNLYEIRSGYVHSLENFNKIEKINMSKFNSEVIETETEIFLTFSGLARLTHHILLNHVMSLESEGLEKIDFSEELPHLLKVKPSPELWIHNENNFSPEHIDIYFTYFLSMLRNDKYNDLSQYPKLMYKIEKFIKNGVKREYKNETYVFYYLFNKIHCEDGLSKNFNKICKKYNFNSVLKKLSIETLIATLILEEDISWKLNDIIKCYCDYEDKKYNKNVMKIPHYFKTLILIYISNQYYLKQEIEEYEKWINKLILELPSKIECQNYLNDCSSPVKKIDLERYNRLFSLN